MSSSTGKLEVEYKFVLDKSVFAITKIMKHIVSSAHITQHYFGDGCSRVRMIERDDHPVEFVMTTKTPVDGSPFMHEVEETIQPHVYHTLRATAHNTVVKTRLTLPKYDNNEWVIDIFPSASSKEWLVMAECECQTPYDPPPVPQWLASLILYAVEPGDADFANIWFGQTKSKHHQIYDLLERHMDYA